MNPELLHETNGSPTSLSSDDSTRNLIDDLEKTTKGKTLNEPNYVNSPLTLTSNESPVLNHENPAIPTMKKPIKFKVRKVSREIVPSPDSNNKEFLRNVSGGSPVTGTQFNNYSVQNSSTSSTNANTELTANQKNMIQSQEKYDYYAKKISKIDKEIEFLQNLLPPYNVEIDYPTRTKINSAIEKLKNKQDELEKKKYALGITISRLWRSRDDSDFWVRAKGMD